MDDWFDNLVDLEGNLYNEGYNEGYQSGVDKGSADGFKLGLKQGGLISKEITSYLSFAETLLEALEPTETRKIKALNTLHKLCTNFVYQNTEDLVDRFNHIKSKHKQVCSLFSVVQETSTEPNLTF